MVDCAAMKFFIPDAENDEHAEKVYQALKQPLARRHLIGDRRIRSLTFRDDHLPKKKGRRQTQTATVGRRDPDWPGDVLAIFEERNRAHDIVGYFVWPANGNGPYRIDNADVQHIEFFG